LKNQSIIVLVNWIEYLSMENDPNDRTALRPCWALAFALRLHKGYGACFDSACGKLAQPPKKVRMA